MSLRGHARGQALVPGKGPCVIELFLRFAHDAHLHPIDVNQFSIITELLGIPPDDVIATIASENVCICARIARPALTFS